MINTIKTNLSKFLKDDRDLDMCLKMINLIDFKNLLFIGVVGSQAHGTATDKSDFDIIALFSEKNENLLSVNSDVFNSIYVIREEKDREIIKQKLKLKNDDLIYQIDEFQFPNGITNLIKYERNNNEGLKADFSLMEIGHYIRQLSKSNSNTIELLYLPEDCIIYKNVLFDELIKNRKEFITKESKKPFVSYANEQFRKMKGEQKKYRMDRNEMIIRKSPLDFITVYVGENEIDLKTYLENNKLEQMFCGLVQISHHHKKLLGFIKHHVNNDDIWYSLSFHLSKQLHLLGVAGCGKKINKNELYKYSQVYALFYDMNSDLCFSKFRTQEEKNENKLKTDLKSFKKFKGIVKETDDGKLVSNDLRLSSIPKDDKMLAIISYDLTGYSEHCQKYLDFWNWDKNKNIDRFNTNVAHGQGIDSKNAQHMLRILDTYKEILETGFYRVNREDKRDFYLSVKKGEIKYDDIIEYAQKVSDEIEKLYENCNLPEKIDNNLLNNILLKIRKETNENI